MTESSLTSSKISKEAKNASQKSKDYIGVNL